MMFIMLNDMVATPFTSWILRQVAPRHFSIPKFNIYDGRGGRIRRSEVIQIGVVLIVLQHLFNDG